MKTTLFLVAFLFLSTKGWSQIRAQVAQTYKSNMTVKPFLKNGDFEYGEKGPDDWVFEGEGKEKPILGSTMFWQTHKKLPVGGSYWNGLVMPKKHHGKKFFTTKHNFALDHTGLNYGCTVYSSPFQLLSDHNYLSFLIAGNRNVAYVKVELLRMDVQQNLHGANINQTSVKLPPMSINMPKKEPSRISASVDTTYHALQGIEPKTGHNSVEFRREWWDLRNLDRNATYVIKITDKGSRESGYIMLDDFRFLPKSPLQYTGYDSSRVLRINIDDDVTKAQQEIYVDYYAQLYGAADLHTHLMSHLSMGQRVMYGAPDIGSLVPIGNYNQGDGCNKKAFRATTIEQALGNCNAAHGGWGTDNTCGNYFRAIILNAGFDSHFENVLPIEKNLHGDHHHDGYPNFQHWPHWSSITHQQMWVDWIKRAYDGGLRTIVAHVVNTEILGNIVGGDAPFDDVSAYNLQIKEIKDFVGRHSDFMQVAYTSEDLRRINLNGKMAVLLGIEVDNFGNFNRADNIPTEAKVRAEIQRVYDMGVRVIFPIHLTDNKFGGMAVYGMMFALSNKYAAIQPWHLGQPYPPGIGMLQVETARDRRINYKLGFYDNRDLLSGWTTLAQFAASPLLEMVGQLHDPVQFNAFDCPLAQINCTPQFKIVKSLMGEPGWDTWNSIPGGHQNVKGLSNLGKFAVKEMMKRGMIIDMDHMSEKSVNDVLSIAEQYNYPLMSGHNGLRHGVHPHDKKINENMRTTEQLTRLKNLGGIFGMGIGESDAANFLQNYRLGLAAMGGKSVTVGSDINGFVTMPRKRQGSGVYRSGLNKYSMGPRTWDYDKEGVAHIGLYPDYWQDLSDLGMRAEEKQVFFNAPDYLVTMWEKAERNKNNVR